MCHGVKNEKLRKHIALSASRLQTFKRVKEEPRKITQAQRAWTTTTLAGSEPALVEIGPLQQSKGVESKGKGDGEKGKDPNGTDKTDREAKKEVRTCFHCGTQGHFQSECGKKKRDEEHPGEAYCRSAIPLRTERNISITNLSLVLVSSMSVASLPMSSMLSQVMNTGTSVQLSVAGPGQWTSNPGFPGTTAEGIETEIHVVPP